MHQVTKIVAATLLVSGTGLVFTTGKVTVAEIGVEAAASNGPEGKHPQAN